MQLSKILLAMLCVSSSVCAATEEQLQQEIRSLQQQTQSLQNRINHLQSKVDKVDASHKKANHPASATNSTKENKPAKKNAYHSSVVTIHGLNEHPETTRYYPTALVADNHVLTYIAGTPVVSSPYLGARPGFDGSDYIVNISSINRDIRLMQQRRSMYKAYEQIGYPIPQMPIISISGKAEPMAQIHEPFRGNTASDIDLGSSELDVAAALNKNVEAYLAIAYDSSPPDMGPRVNNSAFNLNMGFVNIGNLDKSPFYFTAGQLFVPFGRYSSSMMSAPLTMTLSRTKTRPFILGYKSQTATGPFAAVYVYKSDTTFDGDSTGGVNLGYLLSTDNSSTEVGVSYTSSINNASGMQNTGSAPGTTFGGFGSLLNGSETVRGTPAFDTHATLSYDRYNFAAEWVTVTERFRAQDLSYNGRGASPQAGQLEGSVTFKLFNKPSSVGVGYQWTREALALNLPRKRAAGVFNISIWKDTVESIEYAHDVNYGVNDIANGAAAPGFTNANTVGTGNVANTVSAQIGVYF